MGRGGRAAGARRPVSGSARDICAFITEHAPAICARLSIEPGFTVVPYRRRATETGAWRTGERSLRVNTLLWPRLPHARRVEFLAHELRHAYQEIVLARVERGERASADVPDAEVAAWARCFDSYVPPTFLESESIEAQLQQEDDSYFNQAVELDASRFGFAYLAEHEAGSGRSEGYRYLARVMRRDYLTIGAHIGGPRERPLADPAGLAQISRGQVPCHDGVYELAVYHDSSYYHPIPEVPVLSEVRVPESDLFDPDRARYLVHARSVASAKAALARDLGRVVHGDPGWFTVHRSA